MTRRVRSGSSQKHKKMPGSATKWGEFDNQHVAKIPLEKTKKNHKKFKFSQSESLLSKTQQASNNDSFNEDRDDLSFTLQTKSLNNTSELKNETESSHKNINADCNFSVTKSNNSKRKKKMKKQKGSDIKFLKTDAYDSDDNMSEKSKKIKMEKDCSVVLQNNDSSLDTKQNTKHEDFVENTESTKETFCHRQKKKKKGKKVKQSDSNIDSETLLNAITVGTSLSDHVISDHCNEILTIKQDNKCPSDKACDPDKSYHQDNDESSKDQTIENPGKINTDSNNSSMNNESFKNSSSKVRASRKEKYLKKLQKKREELGLLLLPRNVETKLQKIKRRLIEKGFPPEKQKEIMRKARRSEELKLRKVFNPHKVCFNCREPGHILADCPKKSESLKQETGICFKCGSVEHVSYKCPEKIQGFPFAKCFICKEQGHISRDCVKNKHGVYPKGGRCKLCGNVNHLKKDCPTLKKEEVEEENITLHTLDEGASIDSEVMPKEKTAKKMEKKAKIVKYF